MMKYVSDGIQKDKKPSRLKEKMKNDEENIGVRATPSDKAEAFANYLQEIFQPYLPENEAPPSSPVPDPEMNHSSIILNLQPAGVAEVASLTEMPDIIVTEVESIFAWISSNTMWPAPADFLDAHPAITKEAVPPDTTQPDYDCNCVLCQGPVTSDRFYYDVSYSTIRPLVPATHSRADLDNLHRLFHPEAKAAARLLAQG
ncbi:hypothetical protein RUM44_002620 [Polyplax serrata]|uniref:Uncharacterized protein n=1 Tax=Polyplax serrata TaxID=468196 RepID=A0ABR1AF99_POLSC